MPSLIGNKANQVSTNGDLGTLAFQDSNAVNITGGTVDVSAGTAALPTLGTTGDPNTGVFFPAADTVAVATNGVERVRVDTSGNVGVGTVSPTTLLHVSSATSATVRANITSTSSGNVARFQLLSATSNYAWLSPDNLNYAALYDYNAVAERMRIDANGNVGVGVTPSAWGSGYRVLQGYIGGYAVSNDGSSNNQMRLSSNAFNNGTNWIYYGTSTATSYEQRAGEHRFFNAPSGTAGNAITFTQAMTLDASGNLLVGTTSTAGAASNAKVITNGGVLTNSGNLSVATATATTIFSITAANRGRYEVVAMVIGSGVPLGYTAIATVIWDGSGGRVVANNGTNLTITLSGSDVQVTQTAGSSQTIYWSFQRLALF